MDEGIDKMFTVPKDY